MYIYICVCVCIYIYIYVYVYVCMYVYVYMYVCVYVYVCVCVYMRTYIHTHMFSNLLVKARDKDHRHTQDAAAKQLRSHPTPTCTHHVTCSATASPIPRRCRAGGGVTAVTRYPVAGDLGPRLLPSIIVDGEPLALSPHTCRRLISRSRSRVEHQSLTLAHISEHMLHGCHHALPTNFIA